MPAMVPVRLLVEGDRIRIGGTVADVVFAYPGERLVELSYLDVDGCHSTMLAPDVEVELVRTWVEQVLAS